MASNEKDELIRAQNELIGVLFEIIKRFQANNDLDAEYLQLASSGQQESKKVRLDEILEQRKENSRIIARLLEKIQI